jgi:5-methylcytosine-specific restriction endonuclease McrA
MALTRSYTPSVYFTKADYAKRKKKSRKSIAKIIEKNPVYKDVIAEQLKAVAKKAYANKQYAKRPEYKPGMKDAFYNTREWLEVRYKTLVKYGKVCQCCGASAGILHVDHIKPRSKFPSLELDIDNLQVLCEACNIGKSNKDVTDWR